MELVKLTKSYSLNDEKITILNKTSIKFEKNKFYVIFGHSGVGKSTLLNILGLLDNFDSGDYIIDNKHLEELTENEKAELRLYKFGFVFQSYYLNPKFTAVENVMVPMFINKSIDKKEIKSRAVELLTKFKLGNRLNHYPKQLSGGEQQRVALARALANNPEIILADEPTGNLDKENEIIILNELKRISEEGKIVIVVSHNQIVKKYADVILTIDNGKVRKYKE